MELWGNAKKDMVSQKILPKRMCETMTKILTLIAICMAFCQIAYAEPVCDDKSPCESKITLPGYFIISVDPATIIAVLLHCREELEGMDMAVHWDSDGTPSMHEIEADGRKILVDEIKQLIKELKEGE